MGFRRQAEGAEIDGRCNMEASQDETEREKRASHELDETMDWLMHLLDEIEDDNNGRGPIRESETPSQPHR